MKEGKENELKMKEACASAFSRFRQSLKPADLVEIADQYPFDLVLAFFSRLKKSFAHSIYFLQKNIFSNVDEATLKTLTETLLKRNHPQWGPFFDIRLRKILQKRPPAFFKGLQELVTTLQSLPEQQKTEMKIESKILVLKFLEKPSKASFDSVQNSVDDTERGTLGDSLLDYLEICKNNYSSLDLCEEFLPLFELSGKWDKFAGFLSCLYQPNSLDLATKTAEKLSSKKELLSAFIKAMGDRICTTLVIDTIPGRGSEKEYVLWEWLLKWDPERAVELAQERNLKFEALYLRVTVTASRRQVFINWLRKSKRIYHLANKAALFHEHLGKIMKKLKNKTSLVSAIFADPVISSQDMPPMPSDPKFIFSDAMCRSCGFSHPYYRGDDFDS